MEKWNYLKPDYSEDELRLGRFTNYLLGDKFPGIDENIQKTFSLYRFLTTHASWSATNLHQAVVIGSKPMFSLADMQSMRNTVRKGTIGGAMVITTKPVTQEVDESRNEFFDRVIRKLTYNLPTVPRCFDGILWYFYILYNLEQLEFIGPILATILDAITLSLPVLATLSVDVTGKLVGLLPIPYAGIGGEMLGYLISLIFVMVAVSMNISRKHFGTAFKSSLEAIPLIGDALFDAARSFEIGMKRYEISKGKLLKSVDKISPSSKEFMNYYTPDSAIHPGPAPSFNTDTVKAEVATYVKHVTGVDKVENAVASATNVSKLTGSLPNATALPQLANAPAPGNANVAKAPVPGNANVAKAPVPGNANVAKAPLPGNANVTKVPNNTSKNMKSRSRNKTRRAFAPIPINGKN